MTEENLEVLRLAVQLAVAGCTVTPDYCTDNNGMARLLGIKPRALRERRERAVAVPPHFELAEGVEDGAARSIVLWPLDEYLAWRTEKRVVCSG